MAIENCLDAGADQFCPYLNDNLGGHRGFTSEEVYLRYVQYGSFSPITRLHCAMWFTRLPWDFGNEIEDSANKYFKLRYRLLPHIYSAARKTFEDGTPLLQRCDLRYSGEAQAADRSQFLFGEGLLVAPVFEGLEAYSPVALAGLLHTPDDKSGLLGEYFDNLTFSGDPKVVRVDAKMQFNWRNRSPAPGLPAHRFSVRWTGQVGPVPESGLYRFSTHPSGGLTMTLDGRLIIGRWSPHSEAFARSDVVYLQAGRRYPIAIEYLNRNGAGPFGLILESVVRKEVVDRSLWLPPGEWTDLWTGQRLAGGRQIVKPSPLTVMPMYAECGVPILSTPQLYNTEGAIPWKTIVVDLFIGNADFRQATELYEDDGWSNAYVNGACCQTPLTAKKAGNLITLSIDALRGDLPNAPKHRDWVLRVHLPSGVGHVDARYEGDISRFQTHMDLSRYPTVAYPGGVKDFRVRLPRKANACPDIPLSGPCSPALPEEGEVVEIAFAAPTENSVNVFVELSETP